MSNIFMLHFFTDKIQTWHPGLKIKCFSCYYIPPGCVWVVSGERQQVSVWWSLLKRMQYFQVPEILRACLFFIFYIVNWIIFMNDLHLLSNFKKPLFLLYSKMIYSSQSSTTNKIKQKNLQQACLPRRENIFNILSNIYSPHILSLCSHLKNLSP